MVKTFLCIGCPRNYNTEWDLALLIILFTKYVQSTSPDYHCTQSDRSKKTDSNSTTQWSQGASLHFRAFCLILFLFLILCACSFFFFCPQCTISVSSKLSKFKSEGKSKSQVSIRKNKIINTLGKKRRLDTLQNVGNISPYTHCNETHHKQKAGVGHGIDS